MLFENITDPRNIIRLAVQKMCEGGEEYRRPFSNDSDIFGNLGSVRDYNIRGRPICGQASSWLETFLPDFLKKQGMGCSVFTVTSSIQNGCFHHFNMVKIEGMEPVICDLTASQYFNHPLCALEGHTYFAGTRDDLRKIVETAQQNTEEVIRDSFPGLAFHTLWAIDFHYYNDPDFRKALCDILDKKTQRSCLRTESFYYPMEITWGAERSHLLNRHRDKDARAALTEIFQRAGIADLTEEKDPGIQNLINALSVQRFSGGMDCRGRSALPQ